jgi:transcriptional regulator with XRE-family HTH domain
MTGVKKLGERVKNLREEKNYTQDFIAGKLGVTQKAYSKIEAGETRMSVDHLLKIAEILETTVGSILQTEGGNVYNNFNTHNGEGIIVHKTATDKLELLYEKLLKTKDEQIALLTAQNEVFLRTIEELGRKMG